MLQYRILTALILLPLVVAGIFYLPSFEFKIILGVVFAIAGYEWGMLCFKHRAVAVVYGLSLLGGLFLFHQFGTHFCKQLFVINSLLWLICAYRVWQYTPLVIFRRSLSLQYAGLGFIFLLSAWASLCELQARPLGGAFIFSLFVVIWATDTLAFFAGRKWGKHKLSSVSPGKTLEGALGGIVGALTTGWVLHALWHHYQLPSLPFVLIPLWLWLPFIACICLLSILGDLFESLLKRIAQVKDSGKLLPGHGGLLDRIDSLLPTIPLFTLFVM